MYTLACICIYIYIYIYIYTDSSVKIVRDLTVKNYFGAGLTKTGGSLTLPILYFSRSVRGA